MSIIIDRDDLKFESFEEAGCSNINHYSTICFDCGDIEVQEYIQGY